MGLPVAEEVLAEEIAGTGLARIASRRTAIIGERLRCLSALRSRV
jgi:hypothetical protein